MIIESISIVLLINLLGLIWCFTMQSDKLTDLIYSVSFFILTIILWWTSADSFVHHLMFAMITLWSARLGFYLFQRIHTMKKDDRFDKMRKRFTAISGFWILQALSILILVIPVIILFEKASIQFHYLHFIGANIWLLGFLLESIADYQKFTFRKQASNNGKFINQGLWKSVQHPNYLGEILCWLGVFLVVTPSLQGWEWIAIVSPLWITCLLLFISGIPLLRKQSQKKYGHLKSYQDYQKNTSLLVPFLY
jgi:steroid 5-alpha reductase family enzyme